MDKLISLLCSMKMIRVTYILFCRLPILFRLLQEVYCTLLIRTKRGSGSSQQRLFTTLQQSIRCSSIEFRNHRYPVVFVWSCTNDQTYLIFPTILKIDRCQ